MGFITFNETYYKQKLEMFENKKLTEADIYEIRQLLKVLDDLTDEGYTTLNERMEADFSCLTRLRNLLEKEGAAPFKINYEGQQSTTYTFKEFELTEVLDEFMLKAENVNQISENPFLKEIVEYCQSIGYEQDTAYVFLLRDTLLPYVYYKQRYSEHVYPWLISRRFLEKITDVEYIDDDIRLPIYEALEKGDRDYEECCSYCKKRIRSVLEEHKELKKILLDLLGTLQEKKIVIVESGYMGTIPMMLKALDDRVTFKLYTTAPFLYETYKDHLFCQRYEDIRKFETVYSQNLLLQYASFHDGKFYVNISEEEEVINCSLAEINNFIK